jgi:hypothetical protein
MFLCPLCKKKVENSFKGFLEHDKIRYHFPCVEKYGYQKLCNELTKKVCA